MSLGVRLCLRSSLASRHHLGAAPPAMVGGGEDPAGRGDARAGHVGLPRGLQARTLAEPLFNWRRRMAEGGREAVRVDDEVIGATSVRQLEKRIPRARAPLGPQDPRGRDPEEALAAARAKKPLSRWPSPDADGSR
jgi:hypothetical protein